MLRVLFIDRSNPVFIQWARGLAEAVNDLDVNIIFVSDKEPSGVDGNLEVVNVHDVVQQVGISELERKLGFSVQKALAPERSFYDYSSFRRCQRYSDLNTDEIGRRVAPYLNAFDFLIREKADFVIDGLVDNFMTSLARYVAGFYEKKFYMGMVYYWWSDGMFFVDRIDQTSSDIDRRYQHYRSHPEEVDRARMDELFARKRVSPAAGTYPWSMRLKQLLARRTSYEPISFKNWVCRRISGFVSRLLIRIVIQSHVSGMDEEFVLFPLHILPEATLLGAAPEIADQFGLIKNISMSLPFGVKLYVKEHPAQQVGYGLDFGFYRRLTALPNVRYLRAAAPLPELLKDKRCLGVAVINGTVGLEAAMTFRKPVFVFGPALYGAGDCFIKPKDFEEFYRYVQEIRYGEWRFDEEALYAVLHALDDSVARANIDIRQYQSWTDLTLNSYPIFRQFLLKCIEQHGLKAGSEADANTASSPRSLSPAISAKND